MFDKLLDRVAFDDVVAFCERFPEGVRVEYKREPVQIDKIVASLANTVGGFFVIGVRTDDKNMPVLPIEGMPARKGIEEQIVQIAHTAIYPAITPAVRILDVAGKDGRVVVVVKVAESTDAPHAVDDATKVYVRVASTTPPYQLADVDRIEYLLKRRQEPERRREELIQQMAQRSLYVVSNPSKVRVVIAPVYPRGALLPMDELIRRAETMQRTTSTRLLGDVRLIHNGIRSLGSVPGKRQWYFEADTHGILFFEEPATWRGDLEDWRTKERVTYVNLFNFTSPLGSMLNTGVDLLAGATTNLTIRFEVFGFAGVGFMYGRPGVMYIDGGGAVANEHRCEDAHISVSTIAPLETLMDRRLQVSVALLRDVLYAFNWQPNDLEAAVHAVMTEQRLI